MSEEFSLTIEEIAREVPRVNLEVGKIYEVRFTNTNRGPIKMIYIGFSQNKRRRYRRIMIAKINGEIIAYGIGEKYEICGNSMLIKKGSRELGLTHNDLEYIKEKGLDKRLAT